MFKDDIQIGDIRTDDIQLYVDITILIEQATEFLRDEGRERAVYNEETLLLKRTRDLCLHLGARLKQTQTILSKSILLS